MTIRAELASLRLFLAEQGAEEMVVAEQAPPPRDGAAADPELEEIKQEVKEAKQEVKEAKQEVKEAKQEVKEAKQKVVAAEAKVRGGSGGEGVCWGT